MTKVCITSPVEGLNTSTAIGPLVLNFKDSVAEVDSDQVTDGLKAYLKANGYGVDGSTPHGRKVRLGQAEPADATDATPVTLTAEERELLGLDDAQDSEGTGTPAPAPADAETDVSDLKGQALTDALKAAGLPLTGSADEKRAALAKHRGEA